MIHQINNVERKKSHLNSLFKTLNYFILKHALAQNFKPDWWDDNQFLGPLMYYQTNGTNTL